MSETIWSRREFLRIGAASTLGLLTVACGGGEPGARGSVSPTRSDLPPSPSLTTDAPRVLSWRKIEATGPAARRDHTFTGTATGAVLFGGRRGGEPLNDLWLYHDGSWTELPGEGPSPRFGHNAIVNGEALIVFGGQGRGDDFFNDTWRYDLRARRWSRLRARGTAPSRRYGASSVAHGDELVISHGFTFQGRFDDTRGLRPGDPPTWRDLTPAGRKPVERCLHRAALLETGNAMLLFGGQTNGDPYLGDTWLFSFADRRWTELPTDGPEPRNLYAIVGVGGQAFLFGGFGSDGALRDTWNFDGAAWRRLTPDGTAPPPRGGIEAALVDGRAMLVFGGADGGDELDDLWELTLPTV